ncbi:hypothetical protein GCM10010411_11060 [Actinomadura fulvescens]|uniref:Uncharacterized protein n=1 Tax=Actinomadura fulvescens TaxID=46160 RepID=A0ABN3PDD3_9ACTN
MQMAWVTDQGSPERYEGFVAAAPGGGAACRRMRAVSARREGRTDTGRFGSGATRGDLLAPRSACGLLRSGVRTGVLAAQAHRAQDAE